MDSKCADPQDQLDVDTLILDYLIHKAMQDLLEEQSQPDVAGIQRTADASLHQVNDYLNIFNEHHDRQLDVDTAHLQIRLQVLKFMALLYSDRSPGVRAPPSAALKRLRYQNRVRGKRWKSSETRTGYRTAHCYLIDLLPQFMNISVAFAKDFSPTSSWMELAMEFRFQASLEQCISPRTHRPARRLREALHEAFAYGSALDSEEEGVQNLLWSEQSKEETEAFKQWRIMRRQTILRFKRRKGESLAARVNMLQSEYPRSQFDKTMRLFLRSLIASMDCPVLVQLESGQLEGMSRQETENLKRRCGLA
ncbi:hypothetical protein CAC42_6907 [Sphaceloma murrayae]|uniref:Uncharacterized protein n=1 Tax=Sphaceloma murrayae TaxID=2082308 RepID=A0A2K1QQ55_9PEZI|nr:hypothetical protein CAC42_6907 [Sphaceloma murrayae]